MGDRLIAVDGVSKKLCRDFRRSLWYGVLDMGAEVGGRPRARDQLRRGEFWALRDIGFEVRRGECLALIGRNGAGKTTILRMLCGLLAPDAGRIEMRGAVGAMIALGAGVKDVLTGRENIYCMGALRGMTRRDVERRVDEIIEFAELRDAIDAPLQSYSSGMRVRLNFAVASALQPDILLLDEVLAVGDAAFRNKCYRRIADLRREAAVIFVSHNMEQVARTSTHALVLRQGEVAYHGSVEEGIGVYEELNRSEAGPGNDEMFLSVREPVLSFSADLGALRIESGAPLSLLMSVKLARPLGDFLLKVVMYNASGAFAADAVYAATKEGLSLAAGENHLQLVLDSVPLRPGVYRVAFNLIDAMGDMLVWFHKTHCIEVCGGHAGGLADCQMRLQVRGRGQA